MFQKHTIASKNWQYLENLLLLNRENSKLNFQQLWCELFETICAIYVQNNQLNYPQNWKNYLRTRLPFQRSSKWCKSWFSAALDFNLSHNTCSRLHKRETRWFERNQERSDQKCKTTSSLRMHISSVLQCVWWLADYISTLAYRFVNLVIK